MQIPREIEYILANGKGLQTSNPFHIYYKWGQAMVEIKPYGDLSGNPLPRFFKRMSKKYKRYLRSNKK